MLGYAKGGPKKAVARVLNWMRQVVHKLYPGFAFFLVENINKEYGKACAAASSWRCLQHISFTSVLDV